MITSVKELPKVCVNPNLKLSFTPTGFNFQSRWQRLNCDHFDDGIAFGKLIEQGTLNALQIAEKR